MRKYLHLIIALLPLFSVAQNEFYNNGAEVYVQTGAMLHIQGELINDATATSLFQQVCAAGDACEKGEGVTADIPAAFGFYQLACDLRDAIGCHDLGYSYSVGFGVIQDDTLSLLF